MSKSSSTSTQSHDPFVMDLQKIREQARKHMSDGPVTQTYGADRQSVLKLLNDALATEIVCTLRYKRHHFMAKGINSEAVAAEFAEHASEEQEHADRFAERIVQLGGEPDFAPESLQTRSHSEYKEGANLTDMIRENLVAERIAIDTYREIIRYLGDNDVTTRRIFEEVLAVEEEHADDMADLLEGRE
ncbi:ferritin-like domain-containing protein [Paraburkholderia phenazinium]|jgi:bacterioferritin|uniref:Bacterioferritin n=1 Tax=Paraburkholderia phenazinium TaxID=60549 RepID=A0A1G8H624_9BURK|nr:ferritin-like domain-containing protein [Paraburkholderia phenazinium]SDI02127.1 bacterioferritin [Paraburkholderia phenazinium]